MVDFYVTYKTSRGTFRAFNKFNNFLQAEEECRKIRSTGFFVGDGKDFYHISADEVILISFSSSDDSEIMQGAYKRAN